MSTRFVCILATSRTGSSHLVHLLQNFSGLNVKGELFHVASIGRLTKSDRARLAEASDGDIADSKSLCEWRRRNPRLTLDLLYESGDRRPLVFKLFSQHLQREILSEEIFGLPDAGYILLRRRPIDCYISKLKAGVTGTHATTDTTAIKPELKPARFVFWARVVKDWYQWLDGEVARRNLRCSSLSFERHIENRSAEEVVSELRERFEAVNCRLGPMVQESEGHLRQDREPDFRKRVANWSAFEAKLRTRDPDLLRWAVTAC